MTNITDKVKEEIVERQISHIKKKGVSDLINYKSLKKYLGEAIDGDLAGILKRYLNEYNNSPHSLQNRANELNKKMDLLVLKKLGDGAGKGSVARLWQAANLLEDIQFGRYPTNQRLLDFYNEAEKNLHENNYKHFSIRNYGIRSHKLLETYLTQKGLIDWFNPPQNLKTSENWKF